MKTFSALRAITIAVAAAALLGWGAGHAAATPGGAGLPEFPIQCLDGSTVEFGQFCPLPSLRCADGSALPLGGVCPAPVARQVPSTTALPTPTSAPEPIPQIP